MKLLILTDGLAYRRNTKYYSHDTFLHFVEAMADHFASVTLCLPVSYVSADIDTMDQVFAGSQTRIEFVETFSYRTVTEYYQKLLVVTMRNIIPIWKAIKGADVVLLRVPAMNAFLAGLLARQHRKPFFCYFVGDEKSIVETGIKYKHMKLKIAGAMASFHAYLYKRLVRNARGSFFLSMELRKRYAEHNKNAFSIFTSLLKDSDIRIREHARTGGTVNLLSVGRLSYEKGLDHLIICLRRLGSASYKLTLCGDGPYRQRLQSLVNAQGLDDHVHFLGRIPWGQRLSEVYARSDILVLPSLSEGSPKVLLEAMAKGLPVIATRVGGIPDIIEDMENGILVPPGDSQALANAIEMIARNNVLRNKIIENGYRFAKEHTAKKQAHRITEIMRSCAGGSH